MGGLRLGRYLLDDDTARWSSRCVQQLAPGADAPRYGTPEWLGADRAAQVAGALVAAEAYRRHLLFLPDALADGMDASRRLLEEYDMHAYAELAARMQHNTHYDASWWQRQAQQPTHAELVERRAAA